MKIWLINNYNMLPEHGHLNRNYYLGKYLKRSGHEPIAFAGSHPHNTNLQLIEGREKYKIYQEEPFPWVLIKTRNYEGSKFSRVISMFEFYFNMKNAAAKFEKPDAIIGSSAHPLAALLAVQLGKKYGCKGIVEIRDLWPESIVAYGIAGPKNPAVVLMRKLEKWLYVHADAVIFTMEGAYDYIIEQGWEKEVPRQKVFFLNNGVDLEQFEYDREHYQIEDEDLQNVNIFKVVYAGAIRKVNNLGKLLDAATLVKSEKVKFMIWGAGDEEENLRKRLERENISNVIFKGRTEKKNIPYITSKADLNILHSEDNPIMRFGMSLNKLFDYLAAGKPILVDIHSKYDPAMECGAGIEVIDSSAITLANEIDKAAEMPTDDFNKICACARNGANKYDYKVLSAKLVGIIEGL